MRTTLDIADDVLFAAKDYARRDKKTLGQVISEWGRSALLSAANTTAIGQSNTQKLSQSEIDQRFHELGFRTLPNREGLIVTNEMINRIREEEGI